MRKMIGREIKNRFQKNKNKPVRSPKKLHTTLSNRGKGKEFYLGEKCDPLRIMQFKSR